MTSIVFALAAVAQLTFGVLVVVGVVSAWNRRALLPYRGLRRARVRAAQRYARGEIDAPTLRQMTLDLQRGARL